MSEMVERVTRAIVQWQAAQRDSGATDDCLLDPMELDLARAAIKAMREPSDDMMCLGMEAAKQGFVSPVWRAMIDAALK